MSKMIFLNLPVQDLAKSTAFYEAIGCTKNPAFSNEQASCMVWSDQIYFMLLVPEFYSTFTPKPIADSHATSGALICLSFDSKDAVNAVTQAAASNGGKADVRPVQDMGFMYSRAFEDPDGNIFEPMWMDPATASSGAPEHSS